MEILNIKYQDKVATVTYSDGSKRMVEIPEEYYSLQFDFILFHTDSDEQKAEELHEVLQDRYGLSGILYKSCQKLPQSHIGRVDEGIQRSSLLLFYLSQDWESLSEYADECKVLAEYKDQKKYEDYKMYIGMKDMAVYKVLTEPNKFDCLVPVFYTRKNKFKTIPFGLEHLCGIELGKANEADQINELFSQEVRVKKENRIHENVKKYVLTKIKHDDFVPEEGNTNAVSQCSELPR